MIEMSKNNELTDEDIANKLNLSKIIYSNENKENRIDELCGLTRSILNFDTKNLIEVCDYGIESSDLKTRIIKFILKCKIIIIKFYLKKLN
jgi:hypothetical protein